MSGMTENKRYLILENGTVFEGTGFAGEKEAIGEVVFTTGMTGYLETLTDPGYFGQIVVQTFPLIGNYGVIPADFKSAKPQVSGYIVRQWCREPSNYRCEGVLDTFLQDSGITGLCEIDTRALTRTLREHGVMNGMITDDPAITDARMAALKNFHIKNAVASVGCTEYVKSGPDDAPVKIALWHFGTTGNTERELLLRGCQVIMVPYSATAEEIIATGASGVVLSNGPGDPAENIGIIAEIRELIEKKFPMFGICLGHQMIALAAGAQTFKLKYGHRGANQPVCDKKTGRVYVTSQNHGYAVTARPKGAAEWFVNLNDGTCEGLDYDAFPAFSLQFQPEAAAGPHDTCFLFDRFIDMVKNAKER